MNRPAHGDTLPLTAAVESPAWRSVATIVAIALVAMAPELIFGLTITDNYRLNLLWSEQFGEMFTANHVYPRWLPRAWTGLGAPTFYFYPPAIFWVAGAVDAATIGILGPERFVPIATTALLAASGLAMRAWLLLHTDWRRALGGAVAYMLAPYHLYDIYCRGALSEAAAYASVPLLMLGLARLGEGRLRGLPVLSGGYAILLLTHLPTALLISILLIPAYVAWTAFNIGRPARFLFLALAGGLLGLGLAAIYLLPALSLLSFVNSGLLDQGFYRPEFWFFWRMSTSPVEGRQVFIVLISIAAAFLAAATLHSRYREGSDRIFLLWAGLTLLTVFLIAGFFPPFWKAPGISLVQFPWRALLIVEFATITGLVTMRTGHRRLLMFAGLTILALCYFMLGTMMLQTIGRTRDRQSLIAAELRSGYFDAPEYTPVGVRISNGDDPTRVQVHLTEAPLVSASDPRATVKARETGDGGMIIAVDTPAATKIWLRRHYFPHWRLQDAGGRGIPVMPASRDGIVTLAVPAGESLLRLEHGNAPNEIFGRAVSALALLLWCFAAALAGRRADER